MLSPPFNLTKLIDNSGYTALHMAVYKNSYKMTNLLCEYILEVPLYHEMEERKKLLERWINK